MRDAVSLAIVFLTLLNTSPARAAEEVKFRIGRIGAEAIRENSGIVASRKHVGVFWTINDSGNPPALFAITRDGKLIREYPVAAENTDWEDIATDDAGRLYIADTGNNRNDREEVRVFRIDEPDPRAPLSGRPAPLRAGTFWRLTYPKKPFDCESLFILDGKAYLFPKRMNGKAADLYTFDLKPSKRPVVLKHVAELSAVHGPVTAADVSSDGKRLAVLTLLGPYLIDIDGDIQNAAKAPARYSRYIAANMEAACFVEEGLLVTTESRDVLLFRDEHFK
jgi:hypothetical protein